MTKTLICSLVIALVLSAPLSARDRVATETSMPDLRQMMADPIWMGAPVEAAWWQLDGEAVIYRLPREDSDRPELRRVSPRGEADERLDYADQPEIDGPDPVVDEAGSRALFIRDGNLFVRDLEDDSLRQLTRDSGEDSRPGFSADGQGVQFQRDGQWWTLDLESGATGPAADLRFENAPDSGPDDRLEAEQLRLFRFLEEDRDREIADLEDRIRAAAEDPTRAPAPWYLGEAMQPVGSHLSPNGRWMLLAMTEAGAQPGRQDAMPNYVTRSGYVEVEDVRTLVGRNAPPAQALWLLDLHTHEKTELDFEGLEGLDEDPLAELKEEQDIAPHDGDDPRAVQVTGVEWHPDGDLAAVQIRAIDNKDRWLATLDAQETTLEQRHRLTDPAWINWAFNEFGWIPDSDRIWLLSEESGWSHFYSMDARSGSPEAHTSGEWKVKSPVLSRDGETAWVLSNRSHPTEYDLYRLDLGSDDDLSRLTELEGVESFVVHPVSEDILIRHSESYIPTQLARLDRDTGEVTELTDTRSEDYREIEWQEPELVAIESSHDAPGPIWSKFYPARGEHAGEEGRPAVLFVHGAGYLQNVHQRWPQYFREQMFHNLLTAKGYHVLDMDFRASAGYGRDWRTEIYRRMGTPELEDLVDGVEWLVSEHGADPERVGLYGGSYGGFMAFMALFNAPETFAAGAALRPVTDWAHYSHPYTSNILNTPDVDPEAYERSSPIEFAENLEGHLLITHGMLDDNVFYQDVVRMAQRLIELEKENWELATYPLEPHAFQRPESWLDQYRRILALFEDTIGD